MRPKKSDNHLQGDKEIAIYMLCQGAWAGSRQYHELQTGRLPTETAPEERIELLYKLAR